MRLSASTLLLMINLIQMSILCLCVSEVLMVLVQHHLLLWPMPLLVFPMSRSKPQSLHSSSVLCNGAKTVAWIGACSVCLLKGVQILAKHPFSRGWYKFFSGA